MLIRARSRLDCLEKAVLVAAEALYGWSGWEERAIACVEFFINAECVKVVSALNLLREGD